MLISETNTQAAAQDTATGEHTIEPHSVWADRDEHFKMTRFAVVMEYIPGTAWTSPAVDFIRIRSGSALLVPSFERFIWLEEGFRAAWSPMKSDGELSELTRGL